jgi:N6-adenosine-specific RNA methylase IME4
VIAPNELATRILNEPRLFNAELMKWLPKAPPDDVVTTRHQLVDVAGYVKRYSKSGMLEALRAARLTEWIMARRWPANADGVRRGDDRPALGASNGEDREAWQRIYAVGRADQQRLLEEQDPLELTQAAVIRWTANTGPDGPTPITDLTVADVLLVDPPWRYDFSTSGSRIVENHYPTMTGDDLAALELPAGNHVVLFCWATSPKLTDAMTLLDRWGLTYRTSMVWVKDRIGMGYYARQRHELLLIATRGEPPVPEPSTRPDSVIEAPRGEHSAKPELVYELIERMYPNATKRELFARHRRDGWLEPWGLDVPA